MSNSSLENQSSDEIDLVDIIAVFIKRKWIIIWLIIISLIISGLYISLFRKENENYKTNIIITPPQIYEIGAYNLLTPINPQVDIFLNKVKEDLGFNKISNTGQFHSYSVNLIPFANTQPQIITTRAITKEDIFSKALINIQIIGEKKKLVQIVSSLYSVYLDFKQKFDNRNNKVFELTQNTLLSSLVQKREMMKTLSSALNSDSLSKLPKGTETSILYLINTLSSDIMNIETTMGLNETLELFQGSFVMIASKKEINITNKSLGNIAPYITQEKPKKRQLLAIIISIIIAFIIGTFLAFIVEFFSKENVKKRLREIKKR